MILCSPRVFVMGTALASVSYSGFAYSSPIKFLTHGEAPVVSRLIDYGDCESGKGHSEYYASAKELYFEQDMDHSDPSQGLYRQRYFLSDEHYDYRVGGPMFFYLGNEADVTLYVNATGLMWENAAEFGALVVFGEHRYYGKSHLFPNDPLSNLQYLSAEQALLDYVTLIHHLKEAYNFTDSDAVIAFGGSYGGMLASWARIKYPNVWDGAIAASAPILPFEGLEHFFHSNFFAEGVTYDVTTAAGASEFCETNLRKAFAEKALANAHPSLIRSTFQLCHDHNITDADLGWSATNWLNDALSYMSMGNYPYPSAYILNGAGMLPAFPVRVACESLARNMTNHEDQLEEWLVALASFAGVYYNYTSTLECNRISAPVNQESKTVNTLWGYQYCSQIFMVGGQGPDKYDIYWDDPWDGDAAAQRCRDEYGSDPDRYHFSTEYGTPDDWARDASNIVWSQGEFDPWRGGGVTEDLNDSLLAFVISESAHHLDLFFSHENDTEAVIAARELEVNEMHKWVDEKRAKVREMKAEGINSMQKQE